MIVVDTRERASGIGDRLEALGAFVDEQRLAVGDYMVAAGCLVERKHSTDLRHSLVTGRLWPQIGQLRAHSREPYLLLEGSDIFGPMQPDAIRGALLSITDLGVTVIRSVSRADSAGWLYRLAHRRQHGLRPRIRPRYAQRPRSPNETIAEAMLAAVPGLSQVSARALLSKFGSIAALLAADPISWQNIQGVGPARMFALAEAVGVEIPNLPAEREGHAT